MSFAAASKKKKKSFKRRKSDVLEKKEASGETAKLPAGHQGFSYGKPASLQAISPRRMPRSLMVFLEI